MARSPETEATLGALVRPRIEALPESKDVSLPEGKFANEIARKFSLQTNFVGQDPLQEGLCI